MQSDYALIQRVVHHIAMREILYSWEENSGMLAHFSGRASVGVLEFGIQQCRLFSHGGDR